MTVTITTFGVLPTVSHGPLIGIVGPMMSGKSTIAKFLGDYGFTRMALADPVKDGAVVMLNALKAWLAVRYGLDKDAVARAWVDKLVEQADTGESGLGTIMTWLETQPSYTRAKADRDKTKLRKHFQVVGTDLGREYIGPDTIWIDILLARASTSPTPVVCDDVRFLNEAHALADAGFKLYRIQRDEHARQSDLWARYGSPEAVEAVLNHPSETAVLTLPVAGVIQNVEGDLHPLRIAAEKIARGEDPCG